MSATLDELWRLALPPATVLHGGQDPATPIRTAVILRPTQPALPELHGGEVVLLNLALLEGLDRRLSLQRLLERLNGTPIVAIAYAGDVSLAAIEMAVASQIALFELPDCDLRLVQREIQRLLSDPEAQYERRAAQLYATLTRQPNDATQMVAFLNEWTGARCSFPADAAARTQVGVQVAGRRVGMVGSTGDRVWDRVALEQGAAALALVMEREQAIEDRLRSNVIDSLLLGTPLDMVALDRATDQGLNLDLSYLLVAFRPPDPLLGLDRMQAAARRVLDRLQWRGLVAEHSRAVLVAVPCEADQSPEMLARSLHTALEDTGFALDGGFGWAAEPADWVTAWSEALNGLQLGRELLGAGKLAGAAELGIYRLLLPISESDFTRSFYQRTIGRLVEHDSRQDGDLTQTLAMFFAHLGNHSQAAAALHIHRNTLLYRLGRIAAITDHHLDRTADRLALQVGLALHRIYQSQRKPSTD